MGFIIFTMVAIVACGPIVAVFIGARAPAAKRLVTANSGYLPVGDTQQLPRVV